MLGMYIAFIVAQNLGDRTMYDIALKWASSVWSFFWQHAWLDWVSFVLSFSFWNLCRARRFQPTCVWFGSQKMCIRANDLLFLVPVRQLNAICRVVVLLHFAASFGGCFATLLLIHGLSQRPCWWCFHVGYHGRLFGLTLLVEWILLAYWSYVLLGLSCVFSLF